MKQKKRAEPQPAPVAPARPWWNIAAPIGAAAIVLFLVYGPALNGPFLFDDRYLPFFSPAYMNAPLTTWLAGVRPLLMLTFWINHQLSTSDTFLYHALNVLFHLGNGVLIWLILERILEWAGVAEARRRYVALFGAAVFLLHPIQSESVAYIASRSENLSVLLFNAAFAVFLYRRHTAISWRAAIAVVVLFIAAASTKEHTAVLPALLLLTDIFWNPGWSLEGVRRNLKLYTPLAVAAGLAAVAISRVLGASISAGFAIKGLSASDYFFTQCRAIWVYVCLFVLPFGQNADYDFATSHGPLDHGAVIGLIALIGVTAAAWAWRRTYPLAAYGWLTFLLLLAPTSSFIPIADVLVERRLYLPMIGLLLILSEGLRRLDFSNRSTVAALAGVAVLLAAATWHRNQVWASPLALWTDTAEKSPAKYRPRFQLAFTHFDEGRCAPAAAEFERASKLSSGDPTLYVDWGLALDCAGQPEAAIAQFRHAATLERSAHPLAMIGMVYAKQNRFDEALAALAQAEATDANFAPTYDYRGNIYLLKQDREKAAAEFRRALAINPADAAAIQGLSAAGGR